MNRDYRLFIETPWCITIRIAAHKARGGRGVCARNNRSLISRRCNNARCCITSPRRVTRERGLRFGIECGLVVLHCLVRILFEICAGALLVLPAGSLASVVADLAADFVPCRRAAARFIFLRLKGRKGRLSVKRFDRKAISSNDLVQKKKKSKIQQRASKLREIKRLSD